jgi:hypothetical protein
VKSFNQETVAVIRADIELALKAVVEKHGLKRITLERGKFSDTVLSYSMEVQLPGSLNKDARCYNKWRHRLDLPPLHSRFLNEGMPCEIIGLRLGGEVKNVIFLRSDGTVFKVQHHLLNGVMTREHKL